MLNDDFNDMLRCLSEERVEYLLVGGYAMAAHGYPRASKDIGLWVAATSENASRVYSALVRFGAPTEQIKESDFAEPGVVFQIGVPPRRIDIITSADGVDFAECYRRAIAVQWDVEVAVISKEDLIANKRASARPQDLVDADTLDQSPQ